MENSLDRPGSLSTVLPKEQTRHGSRGWKRPLDRGKVSVGQPINLWQKLWLTEVSLNRLASSDLGPSVFVVLCCSIAWAGTRETTGDGTGKTSGSWNDMVVRQRPFLGQTSLTQ